MRYQLAIFDFDGTLADSLPWLLQIANEVAEKYRFRRVENHEVEALRHFTPREIMAYVGLPLWKLPLIARHVRKRMGRSIDRIQLYPGASQVLETLAHRGIQLAIVSSNAEPNVRRVLGPYHAALIRYYGCNASVFGKRQKLRRILRTSGVSPNDTIYMGDEVRDAQAARALGIHFGAITWGYASRRALRAQAPDEFFHRMRDITRKVQDPLERHAA